MQQTYECWDQIGIDDSLNWWILFDRK